MSTDFLAPGRLWLLLVVGALAVGYVAALRWRRAAQVRFTQVYRAPSAPPARATPSPKPAASAAKKPAAKAKSARNGAKAPKSAAAKTRSAAARKSTS